MISGSDLEPRAWHSEEVEKALSAFETSAEGLSTDEAARRLVTFGPNRLPRAAGRGALRRLLAQFHNLLIYVLLAAAVVSFLLDHAIDAAVILAVVVVNAAIGFVQEGRAERALEAIRGMIDPRATVIRDGRRLTIPADRVVPGDIMVIEAGDRIPADLRLLRARNLKVDEAILTGESVAVEKAAPPVAPDAPLGDRTSMAYSGTFVAAGQGTGVVVGTGSNTELGRISTLIGEVEALKTPLIRQMEGFGRQLTGIILAIAAGAFLLAYFWRSYPIDDAFMAVVGLAVAAIPEGLPAIMTITLAIGVQRMAARNAIVRRLPAVETLGSVSVICSDKTGTLTRNEMTARTLVTRPGTHEVTGVGYDPHGAFQLEGRDVDPTESRNVKDLIVAGLLCNDAEVRRTEQGWLVDGDPMEGALTVLAMKANLEPAVVRKELPRTDEIPFDSQHRFMATLHHSHEDGAFMLIKGAPERVLEMCRSEPRDHGERPIDVEFWRGAAERLAAEGQRVLAFARKPAGSDQRDLSFADVEDDAVLLGLIGFIDPPREEAVAAVSDCKSAGIRVVMITGDHVVTAQEIGRQLGLAERPKAIGGGDLDRLDEQGLRAAVRDTTVFARATPEHKLRLVQALQDEGLTVAMTGDGVNDAPALKRADVGVAMGKKGTEAAKEAAEIVLADDNFASIVAAVREGRTVYDNLRKSIAFLLPINGGESLSLVVAILLGVALPIQPLQILWVNMVSSVALASLLAFEPTEPDIMSRRPRAPDEAFLSRFVVWRICLVSVLFLAGIFGMFEYVLAGGGSVELARTAAVNTLVVMEIFYLFSVRYLRTPSFTFKGVKGTPRVLAAVALVVVLQVAFTYAPPLQRAFGTEAVPVGTGALVVAVGVAVLCVLEVEKWLRRRFLTQEPPHDQPGLMNA